MRDGRYDVVLVDDAVDVRAVVGRQLRLSRRFTVVGEGGSGAEAVALAAEHQPDLVLLDASMPGRDGLDALPAVRQAAPGAKVVMLTGFAGSALERRARDLGAADFVDKAAPIRDLPGRLLAVLGVGGAPRRPTAGDPTAGPEPEAVMAEHLERFRTVFDQATIGMSTLTLSGTIVRVNPALADLLGGDEEAFVGRPYADVLAPDDHEDVDRIVAAVAAGEAAAAALDHVLPGGDRWAHSTIGAVRDSAGRPMYLFAQTEDVTGRRQAVEQLRVSEERFRLLVEGVQDYAIFMLDPEGRVSTWNLGAERMKGYRADEIIGRHFRNFYPPEVQAARHPERELEIAVREGRYEEEGWRVRKDGTRFWANVVITALFDGDGRLAGFGKVTRDVTERAMAESALRASEERFRLLVEGVQDYAIFMLDRDGYVTTWNRGAERMKGYADDEIIGRHFRNFYPPEVQAARHPEHELEIAVREGRYEEEGWRVRKDGTRFWANVVITALFDAGGELAGFAKVTRDVTDRRAAAQARERAAAELADANRQLQTAADKTAEFVAVTAHELQSPVAAMTGGADLLLEHWDDLDADERADTLQSIVRGGERIRRLLGDLLTASRLEAGSFDLHVEDVPLRSLLSDVAGDAAAEAGPVVVDCDESVVVRADRTRLAQVVGNLVTNGFRHGAPPVEVAARRAGDAVEVRVRDAGPGVPDELVPRLFDKFARGRPRAGSGTGLGLFIVRELARAQQGDAWYERDDDGRGAFVVRLPAAR
ncbi:MAG TPA: PAS domain S-box protein [Acidimicrobiales bacterium]